ncbi:MAG: glycosyltransferase family 9 protein [Candidatus Hydrogenedentes bacterium]|nr:glycosyltransferase family 9 protein [Candidatus Hydrogenedentota bacterium]
MRILVAQMTRMGDMLQTSPLVRALKTRFPDAHITAMVRRMGVAIAERNPDVDDVIVYDEDAMFLDLHSDDSDRLLKAYQAAESYVRQLQEGRFDVVYNCTHSLASAMLFKLAGIPEAVGAHLSDDWQYVLRGRGPNYFFTSVLHREYNALNLCDLFRHFLPDAAPCQELIFSVTDEDRQTAAGLLAGHGIGPEDFVACFQMGASDTAKRWPVAQFAGLGARLAQERAARIVLVGVDDEAPLGQELDRAAPGLAVHLFGKTSIPVLAALLERANVLVTNDTGTMHIAAAVRCPIVLVSVGYVHFRETGPFGAGHCAVERHRESLGRSDTMRAGPDERAALTPAHIARAVDVVLGCRDGRGAPQFEAEGEMEAVDVYLSAFAPDGCLEWYPLVRRPITQVDLIRIAYRAMWLEFLSGKPDKSAERKSLERAVEHYRTGGDELDAWRAALCKAFSELAGLGKRGARTTEQLLDVLRKRRGLQQAKELVAGLMRLDEEIRLFGEMWEPCKPLVAIGRFERDNLEGADPVLLAETTLQIYRDLYARARLMGQKLDRVAEAWAARQPAG